MKASRYLTAFIIPFLHNVFFASIFFLLSIVYFFSTIFHCRKMRPAQRRRTNDRFMRFDNEDRHQEKKLYSSSDSLYGVSASKMVSSHSVFFLGFAWRARPCSFILQIIR